MTNPVILIHEDRAGHQVGVQLAVASLKRFSPGIPVCVSYPQADARFLEWLGRYSNATYVNLPVPAGIGWNVKPSALCEMLKEFSDVVWLDSDIVVVRDIATLFKGLSTETLLATEETYWGQRPGSGIRTLNWGLRAGNSLPVTINTGLLRVTRSHIDLLMTWREMLSHELYQKAQTLPWYARPIHMVGDQDVLTALLGAESFEHLPVRLLRRGVEVAQCFGPAGFTPRERLRAYREGSLRLVHAMGAKPWTKGAGIPALGPGMFSPTKWRKHYENLSLEVSPYTLAARLFEDENVDVAWTTPTSLLGRCLATASRHDPILTGLPLAMLDHGARLIRKILGIGRYKDLAEFHIAGGAS